MYNHIRTHTYRMHNHTYAFLPNFIQEGKEAGSYLAIHFFLCSQQFKWPKLFVLFCFVFSWKFVQKDTQLRHINLHNFLINLVIGTQETGHQDKAIQCIFKSS